MTASFYKFSKNLFYLVALLLMVLSITACNINEKPDNGDGGSSAQPPAEDESNESPNDIAKQDPIPQIVINKEPDKYTVSNIYTALLYKTEKASKIVNDSAAVAEREVVIGKSERRVSKDAYEALSKLEKETNQVGYLIYFDGQNYALAYEDDKYSTNVAALLCVEYFIENTVPTYGDSNLEKGVLHSDSVDPIEYQRAIDEKRREIQWANLERVAGKEVVEATKEYYARYGLNFIEWCANLYDPETGGFYYSNAARDNPGYLPDIESSLQMLSMFESSGMIDHLGGSIYYMPKDFLTKMAIWVKGLQHPSGYFYHPQWTKEETDKHLSRLGRDLSYGSGILNYAGLSPTFDTPLGWKGDYTLADGTKVDKNGNPIAASKLTNRLSGGVTLAVSKLVLTSNAQIPAHLLSAESFKEYLYTLDLKHNSYWVGNQLSNQVGEIKKRDDELNGALVEVLTEWLIEFQNPKNGMWEWRDENDPTYSDYDGVNGILKLLTLFNNLGIEYPNPVPAAESIIKSIYTDDPVGSVCYCYNAWYALEDLFKNLNTHSKNTVQTEQMISEIRKRLQDDAPALIRKSLEKVMVFVKEDGSSSFGPNESSGTSQGMWVTIAHTNEGDVNGSLINTFGVLNHMFKVLGWDRPAVYGKAEYLFFMNIVAEKNAAFEIKDPDEIPYTYDNEKLDSLPDYISLERCNSSGEKKIVSATELGRKGHAFMLDSKSGGNDLLYIGCPESDINAKCFIFDSDMLIRTSEEGYFLRLYLDSAYAMGLIVENGQIRFIDTSKIAAGKVEKDLGFTAPLDEWFNLRVEYYFGLKLAKVKIFLNGELVATSDNYYDPNGTLVPSSYYNRLRFEVFTANNATIYFDNTVLSKSSKKYCP